MSNNSVRGRACACACAWRLGSPGRGLWIRDRAPRLSTSIPSRRSSTSAFNPASTARRARSSSGRPCRRCQHSDLPRLPPPPRSAAEGSPSRAAARACAPFANAGGFRVYRARPPVTTPVQHRRRRPGHPASGAAGSAAATGLAQGHPCRVRRTCRRLAVVRSAIARRGLATRGGDRSPRRGPPRYHMSHACPQERAPPRYEPRRGSQRSRCHRSQMLRRSMSPASRQAPWLCNSPRRLVGALLWVPNDWKSAGGAAVHVAVSLPRGSSCPSVPLGSASSQFGLLSPKVVHSAPTSPVGALPQALPREKSLGGGAASDTAAALSSGGTFSIREPDSGELAVWVISLIVYGPTRHTRGPAAGLSHNHAAPKAGTNDRGVTTFSPPTAVRLKDSVSKRGEDQSRVPFSTLRGLCLWCNHLAPRQFCLWFYLFPLSFSPDSTNGGRSDDRVPTATTRATGDPADSRAPCPCAEHPCESRAHPTGTGPRRTGARRDRRASSDAARDAPRGERA